MCWASGDSHFMTFDGGHNNLMGGEEFLLTSDTNGTFSIMMERVPCDNTTDTCMKSITIVASGYDVNFTQ